MTKQTQSYSGTESEPEENLLEINFQNDTKDLIITLVKANLGYRLNYYNIPFSNFYYETVLVLTKSKFS